MFKEKKPFGVIVAFSRIRSDTQAIEFVSRNLHGKPTIAYTEHKRLRRRTHVIETPGVVLRKIISNVFIPITVVRAKPLD
jgi:hypothetical protein